MTAEGAKARAGRIAREIFTEQEMRSACGKSDAHLQPHREPLNFAANRLRSSGRRLVVHTRKRQVQTELHELQVKRTADRPFLSCIIFRGAL